MSQSKTSSKNKGGRPRKADSQKIHKRESIYFNKKEHEVFSNFLSKNNLVKSSKSTILKSIVLNSIQNNSIIFEKTESPLLLKELNRIGTNLNQLVKKLNSLDELTVIDQTKVNSLLSEIGNKIRGG